MFDIGFWEITLILIIALLVVGPERLPGLASKAGRWVGQARRMVGNLQRELEREASQAAASSANPVQEVKDSLKEIRESASEARNDILGVVELSADQVKAPPESIQPPSKSSGQD